MDDINTTPSKRKNGNSKGNSLMANQTGYRLLNLFF